MGCATSNIALAGVEQYVTLVEKISEQYKQDVRIFFNSLDAQQTSFRQMTKQDVIHQVIASKEMLILKKYNIQCDLK